MGPNLAIRDRSTPRITPKNRVMEEVERWIAHGEGAGERRRWRGERMLRWDRGEEVHERERE